ncbi:MAG TPA: sodium:solute symporter [Bacteroidales bacterium]|nr:sodium:solute symporter [Bacteroidales bacterium]HSA43257.1 sodium:solute symporter [Bacteroidales bacterium]
MSPFFIFSCFLGYTLLLFIITWITSRKSNNETFFIGNKASPWYVVAYGMIGASLSGVTFMSVPGWVGTTQWTYLMVVFGYLFGYIVIATILLPLYYRLNLTSIYTYLEQRFGFWTHKTGAFFFILSRTIGASLRMFLVVNVLQIFIFDAWGIPFWVSVCIFILLIILYTFKGGIRTIVWTDTLQTTFMLASVILTVFLIGKDLQLSFQQMFDHVTDMGLTRVISTDWHDRQFFVKQFFSGMFITIVMTGLDQEMMQKNLSCRTLRESQKNMFSFSFVLVLVNMIFLFLGAILFLYTAQTGMDMPLRSDDLFPVISLQQLGPLAGLVFMIGLISAAYPSADGALTSLTTSFSIDFLGMNKRKDITEKEKISIRYLVHLGFALILLSMIILFRAINDQAVIDKLFTIAGYTYGPLLGLYSFGLFTKLRVKDRYVPLVAVVAPLLCYFISRHSEFLFGGYKFGFELLIVNGLITFVGLWTIRKKKSSSQ